MLLKKYKNVSGVKFVRIELNWNAGDIFCSEAANCCRFNDIIGDCKSDWIQKKCVEIGMDSKQNKFSYIPE